MREAPTTSPKGRGMGTLGTPCREVSATAAQPARLDRGAAWGSGLHRQRAGSPLRDAPGDQWDARGMGLPDASGGRSGEGNAGQAETPSALFGGRRMTLEQIDDFARATIR